MNVKRIISLLCSMILLFGCIYTVQASGTECTIYVAPNGSDDADGSFENPLATLNAAKLRIRELKQQGTYSGYTVLLRGGSYYMEESLVFEAQDSGTVGSSIVYRSYPGEKVILIGGKTIPCVSFEKVTQTDVLNRIVDTSARNSIYVLKLGDYGITDVGDLHYKGSYGYLKDFVDAGIVTPKPESAPVDVFYGDSEMTLARYPNEGWMNVDTVVVSGYDHNAVGTENERPVTEMFTIKETDSRIDNWTLSAGKGALMYGYWKYEWADQAVPIASIDTEANTITSGVPSAFGVAEGKPYYVYNLIEELDKHGEYYIDAEKNLLYACFDTAPQGDLTVVTAKSPLIKFDGASYVTIHGIDIMGSRSNACEINSGTGNVISNCEISYTSDNAVEINGGVNNGLRDSYIHDVEGGILLYGGNLATLTHGRNYVENCEFERFSRLSKTYTSAISIGGVGNIARHNEIHDGPHTSIEFSGNLNKIMYNEIYDVLKSSDDAGAIYGGLNWVGRGNEIMYNYLHDIAATEKLGTSSAGLGGVFLDGGQCETYIIGNVFENIEGKAVWIGGGRDNVVRNNMMINCNTGFLLTDIMLSVDLTRTHKPGVELSTYIHNSYWKTRFPRLTNMLSLTDDEKRLPVGNVFSSNFAYKSDELYVPTAKFSGEIIPVTKYIDVSKNKNYADTDPGFSDVLSRNYQLKEDSVVFTDMPSFVNPDFGSMQSAKDKLTECMAEAVVMKVNSPLGFAGTKKTMISDDDMGITPVSKNGTVYVPVAFTANSLGMTTDDNEDSVTVRNGSVAIELSSGNTYVKNDAVTSYAYPADVINGILMISIEDISDILEQDFYSDSDVVTIGNGSSELYLDNNYYLLSYLSNALR